MTRVRKERLDLLLVQRGLTGSRHQAQRLIMAGKVTVGEQVVDKPGTRVPLTAEIAVTAGLPYVSRGGIKLVAALDQFKVDVIGLTAADVGASTGGFTDCLLQRAAARVYAIDVGYGQLAWKLRNDPRVIVMERTNARYLRELPEEISLATIDVSFISLRMIIPAVIGWLVPGGRILALIKPQFEVGRDQVGKGGVVRNPELHQAVLSDMVAWAGHQNLGLRGLIRSPITGPAGNVEFLVLWEAGGAAIRDVATRIDNCVEPEAAHDDA